MTSPPQISVVMPVHNALPYLDEAVQSILGQDLGHFEFIVYDDSSVDGSAQRLEQWQKRDSRIRLFRGSCNLGPAASSNEVVRLASAPLIARMDADDVSSSDRLSRELEMISSGSDVGIVASMCDVIDSAGRKLRGPELWRLTRNSWLTPFSHGSMMFRRELFDAIGGYRDECEYWEDLDFVLRASERARILVLPRPLYSYRQSGASTRLASEQQRVENAIDLRFRCIDRVRQGRSYDDLLREGPRSNDERIDPRVFVSLGSLALWSLKRPGVGKRFFARARFRLDRSSVLALAWVIWAALSPATLRGFMNMVLRVRNRALSRGLPPDEPVEWLTSHKRMAAGAQLSQPVREPE